MKRIVVAVGVLALVCAATQAQEAKPGPQHQKMHVWIGDWTWEEEVRDSPSEPWYKATWTGQVSLLPGGFFIEFRWKGNLKGREIFVLEIEGYDPIKKTNVTSFFDSLGVMGHVTSAVYSDNREDVEFTQTTADGKTIRCRCTHTFAADFMSLTSSCEKLTDGEWWVFNKGSATKTKE